MKLVWEKVKVPLSTGRLGTRSLALYNCSDLAKKCPYWKSYFRNRWSSYP